MPVDEDRAIVTVAFGYTKDGIRVRRWTIDPAEAIAALRDESSTCLDPVWRRVNLHESEAEARERYCRCRLSLSAPDPACAR